MARGLQPVRGTHDLLPDEMARHKAVTTGAAEVAERYGYREMATPVFEFTEVFKRTLGDTSDIVTKEMYTFAMREGEEITLRPENTASVARAVISGGLFHQLPLKFFYAGPMFRHERPQKGRQRQFHQIGVELFGVAEPLGDIEIVALGAHVLKALGVLERTRLALNTLGDFESRSRYRDALVGYLSAHEERLTSDSRARLERNPLRILDSKDERDREIVAGAPSFGDFLNTYSRDFFAEVCAGLDLLGIDYEIDSRLVRGLDYYCHTAFEFITEDLGAQGTVLGGGRYDGLVEQMGGPPTPGVGWAAGVERLAMLLPGAKSAKRPVVVVPVGRPAEAPALVIAQELRHSGLTVELGYGGNVKKRMQRADKLNAWAAVILGEDELGSGVATVRNLDTGGQEQVSLDSLSTYLARHA